MIVTFYSRDGQVRMWCTDGKNDAPAFEETEIDVSDDDYALLQTGAAFHLENGTLVWDDPPSPSLEEKVDALLKAAEGDQTALTAIVARLKPTGGVKIG
jgi:hypothetical protein